MKAQGSDLTKAGKYDLLYEKERKYNLGLRSNKCTCGFCRERNKSRKRGKRYRTYRTSIKNAMRSLRKKDRQYGKKQCKDLEK